MLRRSLSKLSMSNRMIPALIPAAVIIAMAIMWPRVFVEPHYRVKTVTAVDELTIASTTDATGVVTARAGVRLTTLTTGPIFISGTGDPNGSVTATIGSMRLRTDTAQVHQNTTGGTVWVPVGSTGSVSIIPEFPTDTSGSKIDNWSPTGLATSSILKVMAGDNTGTLITGIDAIGQSIPVGTTRTICNTQAAQDAGTVSFLSESTDSTANNRIWAPGYGRLGAAQTNNELVRIGPSECVSMVYLTVYEADLSIKRWVFIGTNARSATFDATRLGLWPHLIPAAIGPGTVNDWDPACQTPVNGVMCGFNGYNDSLTYSVIVVTTTDGDGVSLGGMKLYQDDSTMSLGMLRLIINGGPGPITFLHQAAGSSPTMLFTNPNGADIKIVAGQSQLFIARGGWYPIGAPFYATQTGGNRIMVSDGTNTFRGADATTDAMTDNGTTFQINPNISVPHSATAANQVTVDASSAVGRTVGQSLFRASDSAVITTAATIDHFGFVAAMAPTRAGGGVINLYASYFAATPSSGVNAIALATAGGGSVYMGLGGAPFMYGNFTDTDFGGRLSTIGNFRVGASAFGGTETFKVHATNGHIRSLGTSAPTDGANCDGSGAAVVTGTDTAFHVTTGNTASACTLTFASSFTAKPTCTAYVEDSPALATPTLPTCTISATAITCTTVAQNTTYHFHCIGQTGST